MSQWKLTTDHNGSPVYRNLTTGVDVPPSQYRSIMLDKISIVLGSLIAGAATLAITLSV